MRAPELRTVTLGTGVQVEVASSGRGPAILFLHGLTDSWRSFELVLQRLPGEVRALSFSQRGHGESERPASGYHIADLAADAVALLDREGLPQATVVGHSMGSLVAQEMALSHPERVARLVLVGSATTFDNPGVRELADAVRGLTDPVPWQFAWDFQASTVHRPVPEELLRVVTGESLKVPSRVWRDALAGILAFRSRDRLPRLSMPALVVWGAHDVIAPREEQERLCAGIRGATSRCYEDAGHAPHWEEPQRFVDDLMAFVNAGATATAMTSR